jgi:hypothetical protein
MKCNQQGCPNPALARYTWPGKEEAGICFAHLPKLKATAEAIGLKLPIHVLQLKGPHSQIGAAVQRIAADRDGAAADEGERLEAAAAHAVALSQLLNTILLQAGRLTGMAVRLDELRESDPEACDVAEHSQIAPVLRDIAADLQRAIGVAPWPPEATLDLDPNDPRLATVREKVAKLKSGGGFDVRSSVEKLAGPAGETRTEQEERRGR